MLCCRVLYGAERSFITVEVEIGVKLHGLALWLGGEIREVNF